MENPIVLTFVGLAICACVSLCTAYITASIVSTTKALSKCKCGCKNCNCNNGPC